VKDKKGIGGFWIVVEATTIGGFLLCFLQIAKKTKRVQWVETTVPS
jgi:hypothetical protein